MPDDALRLHGRDQALGLVREFATRPEPKGYPTTRRAPILIFTGPKGSGKTALLDSLEHHLRGRSPYARVDCGELKATTAWEVLTLLVFDLNRNAARYRAIPFPRFVTAQVAIAEQIDTPGQAARAQIREALERVRRVDRLRAFLHSLAEEVSAVPVVGAVPGVTTAARYAADLILGGLVRWRRGRRVVLGEGLEWYGTGNQAYDELVRLNLLTRDDASEADRKEATELLWAAFLADLRAAFATGRGARTWSLNCVLLLDDVDTRPGRLLYRALADARRGESDPLTVVATSAGGVARQLADDDIPFVEEAGYDDYLERRQGDYESDSYPVALRDLTPDEVKDMVADVAGPRLNARRAVAAEVYRFTAGHPAATAVVVKAIGDNTGAPASVKRLLAGLWRGPVDKDPVTVEERLLRELLGAPAEAALAALEACSAARDVEQADELARSGLVPVPRDGAGLVPVVLQVRDPGTGRPVMLPALRHLLLRRLAADPPRWTAVHTWLRDNGREEDRHYHALALRDVDAVVRRLASLLPDTRSWLAELDAVTAAPNDLDTD
ncbi:MAG: ATP-binding protein, partial [Saccharothrix sp.]|nr:ATP-binding protein [Saccharothrix sp.]